MLLAVAALAWGTWSFISGFTGGPTAQVDYVGDGTGQVEIIVVRGDTLTAIGQTLADAGVVLTVEAYVGARSGGEGVKIENQVLITEDGHENLTPWTLDLDRFEGL